MASGQGNNIPRPAGYDIREMSFQNVVEKVLKPSGVKVGGFSEELFLDLSDEEKEKYTCNICYMILNDSRECDNKHLFCNTCVLAWSMTYGENSLKCPFCRCDQLEYLPKPSIDEILGQKRVRCLEKGCAFQSSLRIFLMHGHGKLLYSNAGVDFDAVRYHGQAEASNARFSARPDTNNPDGSLSPGGWMLHQMMILMHLEGQLRQHSLLLLESAAHDTSSETDGSEARENRDRHRTQRLGDIIALNEQLNEVGSLLSAFLGTPLRRTGSQAMQSNLNGATSSQGVESRFSGSASNEGEVTPESLTRFTYSRASPIQRVVESEGRSSSGTSSTGMSQRRDLENYYDFNTGGEPIDWEVRSDVTMTTESDVTTVQSATDQGSERTLRDIQSGRSVSSSNSYGLSRANVSDRLHSFQRDMRYDRFVELQQDEIEDEYYFNRHTRLTVNRLSNTADDAVFNFSRTSRSVASSEQSNSSTSDHLIDVPGPHSAVRDYRAASHRSNELLSGERTQSYRSIQPSYRSAVNASRNDSALHSTFSTPSNDIAVQTFFNRTFERGNTIFDYHSDRRSNDIDVNGELNDVLSPRFHRRSNSPYISAGRYLSGDERLSDIRRPQQEVVEVPMGVINQRRSSLSIAPTPIGRAFESLALPSVHAPAPIGSASGSLALPSVSTPFSVASVSESLALPSLNGASIRPLSQRLFIGSGMPQRSAPFMRETRLPAVSGSVPTNHSSVNNSSHADESPILSTVTGRNRLSLSNAPDHSQSSRNDVYDRYVELEINEERSFFEPYRSSDLNPSSVSNAVSNVSRRSRPSIQRNDGTESERYQPNINENSNNYNSLHQPARYDLDEVEVIGHLAAQHAMETISGFMAMRDSLEEEPLAPPDLENSNQQLPNVIERVESNELFRVNSDQQLPNAIERVEFNELFRVNSDQQLPNVIEGVEFNELFRESSNQQLPNVIEIVESNMHLRQAVDSSGEQNSLAASIERFEQTVEPSGEQNSLKPFSEVSSSAKHSNGPVIVPVLDRALLETCQDTSNTRRQLEISSGARSYESTANRERRKTVPNRVSQKVKNISLEFPSQPKRQSFVGRNNKLADGREGSIARDKPQIVSGAVAQKQPQASGCQASRTRYDRDTQNGNNQLPPNSTSSKSKVSDAGKMSKITSSSTRLSNVSGTVKPIISRFKRSSDQNTSCGNSRK